MQQVAKKNKVKKMQNNKIKVKNLFKFLAKSKHKAGEGLEYGQYPFYTSSATVNKYFDEYDFESNKLIFATGGSASVHYAKSKFAVSTDNFVLEPFENVNAKYVYYYLKSNIQILQDGFHGAGLQHLSKDYLSEIGIPMLNSTEQQKIVSILDKADEIRIKKKQANEKLDEFLKSTFVDMFGNPVNNTKNYPVQNIASFAKVKIGPFGSSLHKEEYITDGIPLVNPSQIVDEKIVFDSSVSITEKKYKELQAYWLQKDDIIIGRRGEIGRAAVVSNNVRCICGTGSLFIRINKPVIQPLILQKIISSNTMKEKLLNNSVGVTMNNLNAGIIENLGIAIPPIEKQNKFAQIVEKVEEQKQKNEKVIEQMDNLFNSLSQKAFKGELLSSEPPNNVIDLQAKQVLLHTKIIDKCRTHQTFGSVKLEKLFNICDMTQDLNLMPSGYHRMAAGPYSPKMRYSVEDKLQKNKWIKITKTDNKVEYKKDTNLSEYYEMYDNAFEKEKDKISWILDKFYNKTTDYCEAFSTLYMCWNDLLIDGKNPKKSEIIDEFLNHWSKQKQRFNSVELKEILQDMENLHLVPKGHGIHTIDSNFDEDKTQLSLL